MSPAVRPSGLAHATMIASIRESLASGQLKPGDRIPSESELARIYGISITTVRRGIDCLVQDGILKRLQGSGTYVQTLQPTIPSAPATTIAIATNMVVHSYHPFFSELRRGFADGVKEAGWLTWEFPFTGKAPMANDIELYAIEDSVADRLLARSDLAGVLMGAHMMEALSSRIGSRFPVIAPDKTIACPFASYDWDFELERLLRHVLASGEFNVRILRACEPGMIERAKSATGSSARVVAMPMHNSRLMSEVVRQAFDTTLAIFEEDPTVDALIAGGDFEAQGMIDALQKLGRSWPQDVRIAAMINRESAIRSPLPFTALVADGYANGLALATLLDEHIRRPHTAPRQIILSGELRIA